MDIVAVSVPAPQQATRLQARIDTAYSTDWTPEEQVALDATLDRFPAMRHPPLERYVRAAAALPKKNVRDVALRQVPPLKTGSIGGRVWDASAFPMDPFLCHGEGGRVAQEGPLLASTGGTSPPPPPPIHLHSRAICLLCHQQSPSLFAQGHLAGFKCK